MALSRVQRGELEDAVLKALSGTLIEVANGFRVQTSMGQVAVVYWEGLHSGNDVEIALAPARLTDRYDVHVTHAWLTLAKARYPSPCNIHKYGGDWPIFGLGYSEALSFLAGCQQLRKGILSKEREAEIAKLLKSLAPQDAVAATLAAELESLRPTRASAVIDLVRRAGVSVDRWYVKADGTPAAMPRSNPAYCYNWAFGGANEPALACLWHASMKIVGAHIELKSNMRDLAVRLERIAEDIDRPVEHRERARPQALRARRLEELVQDCATTGRELRVIVNEGEMRDESSLGEDSSFVRVRLLDPVAWQVAAFDSITGECTLRRNTKTVPARADASQAKDTRPRFADQHDLLGADHPDRVLATGSVVRRDPAVRQVVLERADGRCELCDAPGFPMDDGRLYMETHHVQPLSEGGADRVWNVVALCPTHHREVHHGRRRSEMKAQLCELLAQMHAEQMPCS